MDNINDIVNIISNIISNSKYLLHYSLLIKYLYVSWPIEDHMDYL